MTKMKALVTVCILAPDPKLSFEMLSPGRPQRDEAARCSVKEPSGSPGQHCLRLEGARQDL